MKLPGLVESPVRSAKQPLTRELPPLPPVMRKADYRIVPFGAGVVPNLEDISFLHSQLLPRSPLSRLGRSFMERFYYKALPEQDLIFGAIAYVDNRPAGFISATYDSDHLLTKAIRWNVFRLSWVLATTFPSPRRLAALFEGTGVVQTRRPKTSLRSKRDAGRLTGEILSLGIRESYRRPEFQAQTGIDLYRDLISGVTAGFEKSNLARARAIVDADDIVAQSFLKRSGWEPNRRNVPGWFTENTEFMWQRH